MLVCPSIHPVNGMGVNIFELQNKRSDNIKPRKKFKIQVRHMAKKLGAFVYLISPVKRNTIEIKLANYKEINYKRKNYIQQKIFVLRSMILVLKQNPINLSF